MNTNKRKRIEAAGWRVGTVAEFLGLSEKESALVETRVALSKSLVKRLQ